MTGSTGASEQKLEQRIKALEYEIKRVKSDIQRSLMNIKEQLLNETYPELRGGTGDAPIELLQSLRSSRQRLEREMAAGKKSG